MEEDFSALNKNTNLEKIKSFFSSNKKNLVISISGFFVLLLIYFAYDEIKNRNKIKIANKFNISKMKFISGDKKNLKKDMIEILKAQDKTYSPLALYFLIDNKIINSKKEINNYFDLLIYDTKLDKEIKNLIIYKKGLYNSEFETENNLLKILNPVINSDSIWKSHAWFLLGEYFYSKNEKQKSKEFFEKILLFDESNQKIKIEAQKRIQSDFN